uniref:HECT domain-containing protein n=1 Tax=Erpetoichthys calabaricus TaxID=27687 RepID=A0A8C4RM74_ERPCA
MFKRSQTITIGQNTIKPLHVLYLAVELYFKEGLGALEILEAIQHHPEVLKSVFTNTGKKLTASDVENLFTVSMSEIGSNRFQRESFDPEAVSLEDLLIFITGSDKIPPLGFCPTPCLEFLHDGSRFPLANTCDNVIRIPFKQQHISFGFIFL